MLRRTIVVRSDASIAMGTGHVMRCLAIAQAWRKEGGRCIFAMAEFTPAVQVRLQAEECEFSNIVATPASKQDAAMVAQLAAAHLADWIVLDGYQFDFAYQQALKAAGLKVLMLDDGGNAGSYCADLVLDQSPDTSEEMYRNREIHTRLLLGTRYVLLRREFTAWQNRKNDIPPVAQRLLVTIGGSDPGGLTARIIEALLQGAPPSLTATVVVGGSNPRLTELERVVGAARSRINILSAPPNMPELMACSDLAVICAGGTLWELLYMGCPTLSYARDEVQAQILDRLQRLGAVHNLGFVEQFEEASLITAISELAITGERRERMAESGQTIVDGEGPARVLRELTEEI